MKTKCRCGICGHITTGNSKWKTEQEMWSHVTNEHFEEVQVFLEKKKEIETKIRELEETKPSLYSTETNGKTERGSWIW